MGVIDNITGIKVIKPRHEESVRVRFDVTFTFEADASGVYPTGIAVFYSFADDEGTVTV